MDDVGAANNMGNRKLRDLTRIVCVTARAKCIGLENHYHRAGLGRAERHLMIRSISVVSTLAVAALLVGCKSTTQEGVKSSYRSQWTPVMANTIVTTDAAKAVLNSEGLKDVTGQATLVDGTAMGKKADGTAVKVAVKKETDVVSNVTVTIGTLGDPALGAELANKIKTKAEAK